MCDPPPRPHHPTHNTHTFYAQQPSEGAATRTTAVESFAILLCVRAGQTVVIDTCDSNFDTTLSYYADGSTHMVDDTGPCGNRAVIAQTFGSGSHTITVGMYSGGGSYNLRYWCGIRNTDCTHDRREALVLHATCVPVPGSAI